MRNTNETLRDSGIYARLRSVQMSEADRRNAIQALRRAEQFAETALWLKQKVADLGHWFLKPSLKV